MFRLLNFNNSNQNQSGYGFQLKGEVFITPESKNSFFQNEDNPILKWKSCILFYRQKENKMDLGV